jgi:hypothetical protein
VYNFTHINSSHNSQSDEASFLGSLSSTRLHSFISEAQNLKLRAMNNGDLNLYSDSWSCDLTDFNESIFDQKHQVNSKWAATPSYRSLRDSNQVKRLVPQVCSINELNDAFHNTRKPWAQSSQIIDFFSSFGELGKVTLATLMPGGWWPSHHDFTPEHGIKINIPLTTSVLSPTLVFNKKNSNFCSITMKPGEIWRLNVRHRHSAHNWSQEERIYILLTYRSIDKFTHDNT